MTAAAVNHQCSVLDVRSLAREIRCRENVAPIRKLSPQNLVQVPRFCHKAMDGGCNFLRAFGWLGTRISMPHGQGCWWGRGRARAARGRSNGFCRLLSARARHHNPTPGPSLQSDGTPPCLCAIRAATSSTQTIKRAVGLSGQGGVEHLVDEGEGRRGEEPALLHFVLCSDSRVPRKCSVRRTGSSRQPKHNTFCPA